MAQQTGAIYHQGILYSGGSGTNVTPNPQGEATDTLNTVEIDGTIYDIEGGGGTVLIDSAIDENRRLFTSTEITKFNQTPITYTATEDCYALCTYMGSSGTNMRPVINGIEVNMGTLTDMIGAVLPIKKGDTIKNRYVNVSETCYFKMWIYGRKPASIISAPVIYSDEERRIGVWRDNKPLYQKTIDCGYLPNNNTISIDHNISNLDMYCHSKIFVVNDAGSSTELCYTAGAGDDMGYYLTPTKINIVTKSDRTTWRAYATIQYTKTTDVAGSGEYNTLAIPNVHYSTDEQVIGTWMGETLYQKTCATPLTLNTGSGEKTYTLDISNVDKVISVDYSVGTNALSVNVTRTDTPDEIRARINQGNQLLVWSGYDRSTLTIYTTMKYTKTTD